MNRNHIKKLSNKQIIRNLIIQKGKTARHNILSVLTIAAVLASLISPAIWMLHGTPTAHAGIVCNHDHSSECYEDSDDHICTENTGCQPAYSLDSVINIPGHCHENGCYTMTAAHTHDGQCYDEEELMLICGTEESEGELILVCGLEENQEEIQEDVDTGEIQIGCNCNVDKTLICQHRDCHPGEPCLLEAEEEAGDKTSDGSEETIEFAPPLVGLAANEVRIRLSSNPTNALAQLKALISETSQGNLLMDIMLLLPDYAGQVNSILAAMSSGELIVIELASNITLDSTLKPGYIINAELVSSDNTIRTITKNTAESFITIPSGKSITLGAGVKLSGNAGANGIVNVNGGMFAITGGTISGNNSGPGVAVGSGTHTMSGGTISGNSGSGVVVNSGTFTMSGGTISGHTSNPGVTVNGGAFKLAGGTISNNSKSGAVVSKGTFTMSGGTISGNSNSGVVINGGTLTLSDGAISGNTARNGGGVYVKDTGKFTATGGEISGNTATQDGGGIYTEDYSRINIGGNVVFSGNTADSAHWLEDYNDEGKYQPGKTPISVGDLKALHNGTDLPESGGSLSNPQGALSYIDGISKFSYLANNFDLNFVGSEDDLRDPPDPPAIMPDHERLNTAIDGGYGANISSIIIHSYDAQSSGDWFDPDGVTYHLVISDHEGKPDIINLVPVNPGPGKNYNEHTIFIDGEITIAAAEGDVITLLMATDGRHFYMHNNSAVTLGAGSGTTGELIIDGNEYGGGIYLHNNAKLTIREGATIQNCRGLGGGGIEGSINSETLTSDNTIIMTGGTVSGNMARTGGGIGGAGTFKMTGGKISGNTASEDGGGVNAKTFEMTGGEVSDNTASGNGGGVYAKTIKMTAGTISGNNATVGNGGGIYANTEGTQNALSINSGTISGNNAPNGNGGGVYVTGFDKTTISASVAFFDNTANKVYWLEDYNDTGTYTPFPGLQTITVGALKTLQSGSSPSLSAASRSAPPSGVTSRKDRFTQLNYIVNNFDVNFEGADEDMLVAVMQNWPEPDFGLGTLPLRQTLYGLAGSTPPANSSNYVTNQNSNNVAGLKFEMLYPRTEQWSLKLSCTPFIGGGREGAIPLAMNNSTGLINEFAFTNKGSIKVYDSTMFENDLEGPYATITGDVGTWSWDRLLHDIKVEALPGNQQVGVTYKSVFTWEFVVGP